MQTDTRTEHTHTVHTHTHTHRVHTHTHTHARTRARTRTHARLKLRGADLHAKFDNLAQSYGRDSQDTGHEVISLESAHVRVCASSRACVKHVNKMLTSSKENALKHTTLSFSCASEVWMRLRDRYSIDIIGFLVNNTSFEVRMRLRDRWSIDIIGFSVSNTVLSMDLEIPVYYGGPWFYQGERLRGTRKKQFGFSRPSQTLSVGSGTLFRRL